MKRVRYYIEFEHKVFGDVPAWIIIRAESLEDARTKFEKMHPQCFIITIMECEP